MVKQFLKKIPELRIADGETGTSHVLPFPRTIQPNIKKKLTFTLQIHSELG